jgi:hypothetical protein
LELKGKAADVARRRPDGWKYVIDNPSAPRNTTTMDGHWHGTATTNFTT